MLPSASDLEEHRTVSSFGVIENSIPEVSIPDIVSYNL